MQKRAIQTGAMVMCYLRKFKEKFRLMAEKTVPISMILLAVGVSSVCWMRSNFKKIIICDSLLQRWVHKKKKQIHSACYRFKLLFVTGA